jgi:hypothetical protein
VSISAMAATASSMSSARTNSEMLRPTISRADQPRRLETVSLANTIRPSSEMTTNGAPVR